jgi:hypothetical protein
MAESSFLDPLWRRVALTLACALWSAFEWANGEAFWGMLTGAAAVYAAWTYLINYQRGG